MVMNSSLPLHMCIMLVTSVKGARNQPLPGSFLLRLLLVNQEIKMFRLSLCFCLYLSLEIEASVLGQAWCPYYKVRNLFLPLVSGFSPFSLYWMLRSQAGNHSARSLSPLFLDCSHLHFLCTRLCNSYTMLS